MALVAASENVLEVFGLVQLLVDQQQYRTEMGQRLEQLPMPDPDIPVSRLLEQSGQELS